MLTSSLKELCLATFYEHIKKTCPQSSNPIDIFIKKIQDKFPALDTLDDFVTHQLIPDDSNGDFLEDLILYGIIPGSVLPEKKSFYKCFFSYIALENQGENHFYEQILTQLDEFMTWGYDVYLTPDKRYPINYVLAMSPWGREYLLLSMDKDRESISIIQTPVDQYADQYNEEELPLALWFLVAPSRERISRSFLRLLQPSDLEADLRHFIHYKQYTKYSLHDLFHTQEGVDLLLENNGQLIQLVNAEFLNAVIPTGPNQGQSLAYALLAKTFDGIELLESHDNRLANLINEQCLNSIVPEGPNKGTSIAFLLAATQKGIELLESHNKRLANLINEQCLNTIVPEGPNKGKSIAFLLAATQKGVELLKSNAGRLNNQCINAISNNGESVAFRLTATTEGIELLKRNKEQLTSRCFNTTISTGPNKGKSVAYRLLATPKGIDLFISHQSLLTDECFNAITYDGFSIAILLKIKNMKLAYTINKHCLNATISNSQFKGLSLAHLLAFTPEGIEYLHSNEGRLANLIDKHCFISTNAHGISVAFLLASTPEGIQLLKNNEERLANFIDKRCVNITITNRKHQGQSVAFRLAATPEGIELLKSNEGRLINLIDEDCLNAIIEEGMNKDQSVAFLLANTSILKSNAWKLADLISSKCLNHIITSGPNQGLSVAFLLAATPEGVELLNRNEGKLANLITAECLNATILSGAGQGQSVAFRLAITPEGIELLKNNNGRLAKLITEQCLHTNIPSRANLEQSVALCLATTTEGQKALRFIQNNRFIPHAHNASILKLLHEGQNTSRKDPLFNSNKRNHSELEDSTVEQLSKKTKIVSRSSAEQEKNSSHNSLPNMGFWRNTSGSSSQQSEEKTNPTP